MNLIGSLPESLTQGLLIGKVIVGGLGVYMFVYNTILLLLLIIIMIMIVVLILYY